MRALSISPNGLYLASGDEDHNVVIWHTRTSKIVRSYKLPNKVVDCLEWNPDPTLCILAAANEENVHLIAPELYSRKVNDATRAVLKQAKHFYEIDLAASGADKKEALVKWEFSDKASEQVAVSMTFKHIISRLTWHPKGDYFSSMAHNIQATTQVVIHSLKKASSQRPFSSTKGIV